MISPEVSVNFIVGLIFNQSYDSEKAWKTPRELKARLNLEKLDLKELERIGYQAIYEAVSQKPCLHRFPSVMAKNLYSSIQTINSEFMSNPRNIWSDADEEQILKNLKRLKGIGDHKAVQGLLLLSRLGETPQVSDKYMEYMKNACEKFHENADRDVSYILNQ